MKCTLEFSVKKQAQQLGHDPAEMPQKAQETVKAIYCVRCGAVAILLEEGKHYSPFAGLGTLLERVCSG